MSDLSNTPCTHTQTEYDAKADTQYHTLREGMNAVIVSRTQTLTEVIANPETDDRLRLVRIGTNVFKTFLETLPEQVRQQYNCRTCQQFFNGYGTLAFLTRDLKVVPLAFTTDPEAYNAFVGDVFADAYQAILGLFDTRSVMPVTVVQLKEMGDYLGTAERGGFHHIHHSESLAARAFLEQIAIDTNQTDHGYGPTEITLIHDAFQKYNGLLLEKTLPIPTDNLRDRDVYELDLCKKMTSDYMALDSKDRSLWVLRYLMDLGLGIVHFKNSVVGQLVEDIQKMDLAEAMNNYYAYTDPVKYKRKVALPSEREFETSVAFLTENDYTRKLMMRFATLAEVQDELAWKPVKKAEDVFAGLRAKVKTEEDARNLSMPKENISILGFNHTLEKLLKEGKVVGLAYSTTNLPWGTFTRNVEDDAGDIYKDGKIIHTIYWNKTFSPMERTCEFNGKSADGLFQTKSAGGDTLYSLVFGGKVNLPMRPLNYVEDLIDALKPHQRLIDTWANTMYLNPLEPTTQKPVSVDNATILVPLVVNPAATISIITDSVVHEFAIVSER